MDSQYHLGKTPLFSLPNELLLLVRDHLGPSDLLGHACFYLLHPRTRACYRAYDNQPRFWTSLLFENGLTLSTYEVGPTDAIWRMAAIECAQHAWVCKHPACGVRRLEANKASLQEVRQSWSTEHWDGCLPFDTFLPIESPTPIKQNPLFLSVGFNNTFPPPQLPAEMRSILIGACAFLRETPEDVDGWLPTDLISMHPIARRSFATFPPVNSLFIIGDILKDGKDPSVTNYDGVTVLDALTALSEILGMEMSEDDIGALGGSTFWPEYDYDDSESESTPGPFSENWPPKHVIQVARCAGNLFQLAQWMGFRFDIITNEALAFIEFESKPLLDNAWSHFVECTYPKTEYAAVNALNGFQHL
ncbi:hypothetical protein PsYK624_170130 [Phanerochaete sordida]|uniref:Uncharacterized protein n=1 Tax=Phanerochaete sordida TaxID=48140 RepID=A0A9P3GYJ1_9APHY|nr:hypothetical protein PsYK624_170130 [Phanerochaete sordida]